MSALVALSGGPVTLISKPDTLKPQTLRAKIRSLKICRLATRRPKIACFALAVALAPVLGAQQNETVPVMPPSSSAAVSTTHPGNDLPRAFISVLPGTVGSTYPPATVGTAYNEFYAALKKLGQYELVTDPARADQILEMRLTVPWYCTQDTVFAKEDMSSDPRFELVVRDLKTNTMRGPYVVDVKEAVLVGTWKKNFVQAVNTLAKLAARKAVPDGAALGVLDDAAIEPPAPAPISSATTVFISSHVDDRTGAMKGPDEVYRQVYEAMEKWGRYKLVSSAADADLLGELVVSADSGRFCTNPGWDPHVELRLMVPKSNVVVFGFSQHLVTARMSYDPHAGHIASMRSSQEDLQKMADALVAQVRRLTARGDAAASPPKVTVP
jgi:hypothetical protein